MKTELFNESQAPNLSSNDSIWEMTFSSEFDVGDDCAKFTPCYSRRPLREPGDTEVAFSNSVRNCFVDQNETRQEK